MSKLKLVLLALLGGPLLIYGAIKGYAYLTIKGQLDALIRMASPFADIRYRGIGASFDGTLRIENLLIYPHGHPEQIGIEVVELHTPGLWFLLNGQKNIRRHGLPERLGVSLLGMHLDMNRLLGTVNQPANGLACGWRMLLMPDSLGGLGYSPAYDMKLLMLRRGNDGLVLQLETRAHDLQYMQLEISLAGFPGRLLDNPVPESRMKAFTLRYGLGPGYVAKALDYCAKHSDLQVDELLQRLSAQDDAAYLADLGFVPGLGIREALVRYLRSPGEIQVTARPSAPVDLAILGRYRPQDLANRLNVRVSLDQIEFSDLSFKTVAAPPDDTAPAASAISSRSLANARKAELNNLGGGEIVRNGIYYRLVAKEQVPDLLGRDIWVVTTSGSERQGRVVKVEGGVLWLKLRLRGGSMTTSVALADTEKIALRTARRH